MQSQPGSSFAGCHVLAEFTGVDPELANDRVRLRHLLRSSVERDTSPSRAATPYPPTTFTRRSKVITTEA